MADPLMQIFGLIDDKRLQRACEVAWKAGSPVPPEKVDAKTWSFFKSTIATAIIEYRKEPIDG